MNTQELQRKYVSVSLRNSLSGSFLMYPTALASWRVWSDSIRVMNKKKNWGDYGGGLEVRCFIFVQVKWFEQTTHKKYFKRKINHPSLSANKSVAHVIRRHKHSESTSVQPQTFQKQSFHYLICREFSASKVGKTSLDTFLVLTLDHTCISRLHKRQ